MTTLRRILVILLVLVCIVNVTLKDTFYWSSLFFYAFPKPVIVALALILGISHKKKTAKYVLISIAIIYGIMWCLTSYRINENESIKDNETSSIVFWNARKQNDFIDAFEELDSIPELLVIVEYDRTEKHSINQIKQAYPNYHFTKVINKVGIMSKNEMVKQVAIHRHPDQNSFMFEFEVILKNEKYYLYVLDITADLTKFRKAPLDYFYSRIKRRPKTLLMGDFNTPYESVHFKNYKKEYNHSFTIKGNGFRETWFWNIPLLSLDHIWTSKDLKVISSQSIRSWKSDHVMLKISI